MESGRRLAFQHVTGVDLEGLSELWIVSYEVGTLYLLPKQGAEAAEDAFTVRSPSSLARPSGHSSLRIYSSSIDGQPHSLIVSPFFVAFVDQDPLLTRLVTLNARGKMDDVPPSPDSIELRSMAEQHEALVSLYWPGPLLRGKAPSSPTLSPTDSLLSIRADIRVPEATIELAFELTGAWGEDADATKEVEHWTDEVLNGSELQAIGLDFQRERPATCITEDDLNKCQLLMSLDPEAANQGLLRLLAAELSAF